MMVKTIFRLCLACTFSLISLANYADSSPPFDCQYNPPNAGSKMNFDSQKMKDWTWMDLYAEIQAASYRNLISNEIIELQLDDKLIFSSSGLEKTRLVQQTSQEANDFTLQIYLKKRMLTVLLHCIEYPSASGLYILRDLQVLQHEFNMDKPVDMDLFKKLYLNGNERLSLILDYQENALVALKSMRDLQQNLQGRKMRLPISVGWVLPDIYSKEFSPMVLSELHISSQKELNNLRALQRKQEELIFSPNRSENRRRLLQRIKTALNQYPAPQD